MYTPNTHPLKDNQFVDTYGFFTLRNKTAFNYHVPKNMNYGKIGRYSGSCIRLKLTGYTHYGNVVTIEPTNLESTKYIKTLDLRDFKEQYKRFANFETWTSKKRIEGENLFSFLHKHNPIYIQKHKNWIKQFNKDSKIGQHVIISIKSNHGKLKLLKGHKCIFIVTYNKGFKNGFIVLPLD
jgi:hypothetical protein